MTEMKKLIKKNGIQGVPSLLTVPGINLYLDFILVTVTLWSMKCSDLYNIGMRWLLIGHGPYIQVCGREADDGTFSPEFPPGFSDAST